MPMNKENATILILLVGEASGVFASFNPSWFTVSSPFFQEQGAQAGNRKRIRWGEIAASAIVIGTGYAVAYNSDDKTPLYAAIGISALFVAGYEYMMAHPATEDGQELPTKSNPFRILGLKPCEGCQ